MKPPVKIFVGNLRLGSNPDLLRKKFAKFGRVTECAVVKKYGFVVSIGGTLRHNIQTYVSYVQKWEIGFNVTPLYSIISLQILHMPPQHSCRAMCKIS